MLLNNALWYCISVLRDMNCRLGFANNNKAVKTKAIAASATVEAPATALILISSNFFP